ncbi:MULTISPECIES: trypco2 family protein [unclassified Streptomyces]|uniref:trypco2 family protein n=1 Tax=unclassified Streptomyces TaxID=2593676 RepID=UPI00331A18A6
MEELALSEAIEALRAELEAARRAGQGRSVRFDVAEVTVTLEAVAGRDRDGSGRVQWWVLNAGGGTRSTRSRTQTLTLRLVPKSEGGDGADGPLEVTGVQRESGD